MSNADALTQVGLIPGLSRVAVVGLGKTGLSVVRFLATHRIDYAVVDSRKRPPGWQELKEDFPEAAVFLGGFKAEVFRAATHVLVSPGVSLEEPTIQEARHRGVRLISDIDLFACVNSAPVIAITGSNGKSTVTTLVGAMAEAAGLSVQVGGNLGTPVLEMVQAVPVDLVVLELSSFQLERTHLLEPVAATVLNISPDHMDRHATLATYARQKQRVFRGQGVMVLNADDPEVMAMANLERVCVHFGWQTGDPSCPAYTTGEYQGQEWLLRQGEPLLAVKELRMQGRHNVSNALAALALADPLQLPLEAMRSVLQTFTGLEHRMQWVSDMQGVTWINDSKATNVGACEAALLSMAGGVILIAGGDGKGADFTRLAELIADKARLAILMGQDAEKLDNLLGQRLETVRVDTMVQAVQAARQKARPGDTVLLSPACASLDQYNNYQERGRVFIEAVRRLAA